MKKTILFIAITLTYLFSNAQVFDFEDFEGFEEGNFFEKVNSGFSVNAQKWRSYSKDMSFNGEQTSDNLGVENFQIVEEDGNKLLRLQSPNNTTGFRSVYKVGFKEAWAKRTEGNDILKVKFDIRISPTDVASSVQVNVVSGVEHNYGILAGISFNTINNKVIGVARRYNSESGVAQVTSVELGEEDILFKYDTKYTVLMSFDYAKKEIKWYCPDLNIDAMSEGTVTYEPNEVDVYLSRLEDPHAPTTVFIDNFKQEFANNNDLTSTEQNLSAGNVKVSPNPVIDNLNIKLPAVFNKDNTTIEVYNLIGKMITRTNYANIINVSNLKTGIYLLKISDKKHQAIQKIIKK